MQCDYLVIFSLQIEKTDLYKGIRKLFCDLSLCWGSLVQIEVSKGLNKWD